MDRGRISRSPGGPPADGQGADEWAYGDLDAGFKSAALVVDETFVVQTTSHQPMETRSAMAYWQNGKLYLHGSTQSVARTRRFARELAGHRAVEHRADQRVLRRRLRQQGRRRGLDGDSGAAVEEGGRAGDDAHQPRGRALHRPRADRHGRPREGRLRQGRPHHRARSVHRRKTTGRTGRWATATGRPLRVAHLAAAGDAVARRGRAHQHAAALAAALAGGMQGNAIMEPVVTKAARKLGLDQVAIRRINSPEGKAQVRPGRTRRATGRMRRALREGGARSRRASCSSGTSARRGAGSGRDRRCAASASRSARTAPARSATTACFVIQPDGKLYVQSGIGNLGTHSCIDCQRASRRDARRAVGEGRSSPGATPRRTCRGSACRSAARRRTR